MARGGQIMDQLLIEAEASEEKAGGPEGPALPWRLEVKPFVPESQFPSPRGWELKEVALEIRYMEGGRERRVEMRTLRLVKEKNR
jgi:hypothetical protein